MRKEFKPIWISRELFEKLSREKGKIRAETGREPTWDEFLRKMFEIYKELGEEVIV